MCIHARVAHHRYFEVKMTVEDTETVEEIIYQKSCNGNEESSESWSSNADRVETDQITSTQQEEQRRYLRTSQHILVPIFLIKICTGCHTCVIAHL